MSVKYAILLGGCGFLIWSVVEEGIRVAGSFASGTTLFAASLKEETKTLQAVKASVDDLVKPDGVRPEVLRVGLIPGSECPTDDTGRPEAETRLVGALRPRADVLAATRKFTVEFVRDGGPNPARLTDFSGIYRQLLVERQGVAADEARALTLVPRVVEQGEGQAELISLLERLKTSRVVDQRILEAIKRGTMLTFPPPQEVVSRGNTLLLVLMTADLKSVTDLVRLIGQIQPDQLIGGSAWSVSAQQTRKWSGNQPTAPGPGKFASEDFTPAFSSAFRATREVQSARGASPFQTIIVYSNENNPDEIPPGERGFGEIPDRTRVIWLTRGDQDSTRLLTLFRSGRVDVIDCSLSEKLAGLPSTINNYIINPLR